MSVLLACKSNYLEVDNCFSSIDSSYETIFPDGRVQFDDINLENQACLLYFFDSNCPSCWYKYEDISSCCINNLDGVRLLFFSFNYQPELILHKQYENFVISSPVRLLTKLPDEIKDNTIYLYKNKKVFMMLNSSIYNEIDNKAIEKMFLN